MTGWSCAVSKDRIALASCAKNRGERINEWPAVGRGRHWRTNLRVVEGAGYHQNVVHLSWRTLVTPSTRQDSPREVRRIGHGLGEGIRWAAFTAEVPNCSSMGGSRSMAQAQAQAQASLESPFVCMCA